MSEAWLYHLLLHSVGLALLGLLTRAGQRWWRRDASAGYLFLVAVLWAALLLPAAQLPLSGIRPARPAGTGPGAPLVLREVRVIHRPGETAAEVTGTAPGRARDSWLSTALGVVYVGGLLAVASFRLLRRWQTRRLLAWCRPVRDPRILALWQDIAAGSPLADRVRLLTCPGLRLPCCGGFWRPYLLIPEADTLSPDNASLPWALRHELVHLERGDARLAALQAVLVTLYWFHPVAWWLARQLDWWREVSCDLLVVRRSGRRKSYALALLAYASCPGGPRAASRWPGGTGAGACWQRAADCSSWARGSSPWQPPSCRRLPQGPRAVPPVPDRGRCASSTWRKCVRTAAPGAGKSGRTTPASPGPRGRAGWNWRPTAG
jgi:hypothetical protein